MVGACLPWFKSLPYTKPLIVPSRDLNREDFGIDYSAGGSEFAAQLERHGYQTD
jgi:hypothetical protein